MKQLRVYLDTSVIGGCKDFEFSHDSEALLEMARNGEVMLLISDLLFDEVLGAPAEVVDVLDTLPPTTYERVIHSDEARRMRDLYIEAGVVSLKSIDDAHHVALATVARADLIVSWNFKHIVHLDKIRGFNAVNLREGHQTVEIRSPKEVV